MNKVQLNIVTQWLIDNVFRNASILYDDNIRIEHDGIDLVDIIASLHNLLYESVNGERYDYMFHWCNKEGSYCLDNIFDTKILKGGEKMLSDKFFEEYTKTGPPQQDAGAEDPEKMYTAAEVDKLVADKVEAAVKEIKSSMANNPDIPEHEEGEE